MEQLNSVKVKHRIFEDAVRMTIPPGATIQQIIDQAQIPDAALPNIVVLNHGSVIADWGYVTKDADNIAICVVPKGKNGKSILGAVAMIAIAAFAWWAAPAILGFGVGAAGYAAMGGATIMSTMIAAGITMVGSMAMNALIKPPSQNVRNITDAGRPTGGPADAAEGKSFVFGGQSNTGRKYQPSLKVYGRHRVFPALAANPLIENAGTDSFITSIYDFGLGNLRVESLRIGDADAAEYDPTLVFHYGSLMRSTSLYPRRVSYDTLSYVTKQDDPFITRTKPQSISGQVDMYFPRGLVFYDNSGKRLENKVQLEVWWKEVNSATWVKVRDDQFKGATVRQDIAVSTRIEEYVPGGQTGDVERYSINARPESYWHEEERTDSGGDYNGGNYGGGDSSGWWDSSNSGGGRATGTTFETTVVFEGRTIYGGWDSNYNDNGNGREAKIIDVPGYQRGSLREDYGTSKFYSVIAIDYAMEYGTQWMDFIEVRNEQTYYGTIISHNGRLIYNGAQLPSGVYENYVKGNSQGNGQPSQERREEYYSLMVPQYTEFVTSTVVGATAQPFTLCAAVDFPKAGTYEFKIIRRTPVSEDNRSANAIVLNLIKSFQSGSVFNLDRTHTMVEVKLFANEKVSGVVSNLSAICTSVLRKWNGSAWVYEPSRNPAWVVYDILTGEANNMPLRDSQIDLASFVRLANMCDEQISTPLIDGTISVGPRYAVDLVIDYETTVYQLIESILSSCRATLIISQSGKYGVLIDQAQTTPRQLFTPANSWGFSGNRTFADRPHALRVKYVEPELNWQMNEVIVYDDGRNASNSTLFEDLATFGITDGARAWRFGRYMLAQGLQRSEQFTINVDVENLAVQRGDLIRLAHDVPKIGGIGARVVSVRGNQIKVSEPVGVQITHYTIRLSDGLIRSGVVLQNIGDDEYVLDNATGIDYDDLIVLGNTERVTQEYLVQEIQPGVDLSAELTLVRYVPGVYTADEGEIPPWDAGLTENIVNQTDLRITKIAAESAMTYVSRQPVVKVKLTFEVLGKAYALAKVYLLRPGFADTYVGDTNDYRFIEDVPTNTPGAQLGMRNYKVVPYNANGVEGGGAFVSIEVFPDTTAPAAPYGFSVNVQSELVEIFWQLSPEPDVDFYILRYTPEVINPQWDASQFLSRVGWQSTHASSGARTGTYMIRATDTSGNESAISMQRTTVATLPNINYVEEVDDKVTGWNGTHYGTMPRDGNLVAKDVNGAVISSTYYNCFEMVNLGAPFEVRISSKIKAYGEITNVSMTGERAGVSVASSNDWDAWLEVRCSSDQVFIAEWLALDEVDRLSSAYAEWGEWRAVQVGDFTGQLFQFRIQLRSADPNVRPVVTDGRIEVDMPDRIDYGPDVVVPLGGTTIFFNPAFRVPPSIAISIDGNSQPVVANVTYKDADSFDIQLLNVVTNVPVEGKIDWHAKGYGRRATVESFI